MSKLAIALATTVALTSSARRLVRHLAAHAVGARKEPCSQRWPNDAT